MKKQVEFYEDFIALQPFHKRLIQSSGNQSISGVFFSDFFFSIYPNYDWKKRELVY